MFILLIYIIHIIFIIINIIIIHITHIIIIIKTLKSSLMLKFVGTFKLKIPSLLHASKQNCIQYCTFFLILTSVINHNVYKTFLYKPLLFYLLVLSTDLWAIEWSCSEQVTFDFPSGATLIGSLNCSCWLPIRYVYKTGSVN